MASSGWATRRWSSTRAGGLTTSRPTGPGRERPGPGGQNLAVRPITVDAAGRHLLAYGYRGSSRVTVMNRTTGRRASTTAAQLVVEGALTTVHW
jgi:YD repeat-containing protein